MSGDVGMLTAMGFSKAESLAALASAGGDVDTAVAMLLSAGQG